MFKRGTVRSSVWALVLVVAFSAAGLIFAEGTSEKESAEELQLGVMYSLTGTGAPIGKTQLDGANLAIKQVNDRGGLALGGGKVRIKALVRDDETKPDVAIRRYRELVSSGVRIIVGGTFAHVATALNEQAQDGSTFVMLSNGTEEQIYKKGTKAPYLLTALGAVNPIGRMCADYVAKRYDPDYVILCLPDYAYGHGAHEGAMKVFGEKYPQIKVDTIWTPVGTPDFTSYIIKMKEAKPDVVMMGQWGNDAIEIIKQSYELGLRKDTVLYFNSINAALALGIPPEALDGVVFGLWLYHDLSEFENKDPATVEAIDELTREWRAEYGAPPDVMATYAYISMKETLRAIELAGTTDPAAMYDALMKNPVFMSVKGPAKWRPDGRPFYTYAKFMAVGRGASERADKYDYAKVIDVYQGEELVLPLEEMGYK